LPLIPQDNKPILFIYLSTNKIKFIKYEF